MDVNKYFPGNSVIPIDNFPQKSHYEIDTSSNAENKTDKIAKQSTLYEKENYPVEPPKKITDKNISEIDEECRVLNTNLRNFAVSLVDKKSRSTTIDQQQSKVEFVKNEVKQIKEIYSKIITNENINLFKKHFLNFLSFAAENLEGWELLLEQPEFDERWNKEYPHVRIYDYYNTDLYLERAKNYLKELDDLLSHPQCKKLLQGGEEAYDALESSDTENLKKILEKGCCYVSHFLLGKNLLHQAASLNQSACHILVLIENGIDPNARDMRGNTALHWSVANAEVVAATVLLKTGKCDLNSQDWGFKKQTPLQLAIAKGRRNSNWGELVSLLIENTSEINKANVDGNTALHLAFARRDVEFINALLARGADLKVKNLKGQEPRDLWDSTYEQTWEIVDGEEGITTLDESLRNQADLSKIIYYNKPKAKYKFKPNLP